LILLTIVQDKNQIKNMQEMHYIVKIPKAQEMNNNKPVSDQKVQENYKDY
jgi:hypothetical protein